MSSLPHDSAVAASAAAYASNPSQPSTQPASAHAPGGAGEPGTAGSPGSSGAAAAAPGHRSPLPTWAWLAGAAMLAAIVGLTTALVQRAGDEARAQRDPLAALSAPGAGDQTGDQTGPARDGRAADMGAADGPALRLADAGEPSGSRDGGTSASRTASAHSTSARTGSGAPATTGSASTDTATTEPVARCATCGTVESVRAVQVAGQGTGLGAVAGGVVGGVVGNQFGKGSGNTAMTVLGAVGGGYAGHQIEKRARSQTVYQVRVRMADGSLRTVQSATAWSVGARVRVEGNKLHSDSAS